MVKKIDEIKSDFLEKKVCDFEYFGIKYYTKYDGVKFVIFNEFFNKEIYIFINDDPRWFDSFKSELRDHVKISKEIKRSKKCTE